MDKKNILYNANSKNDNDGFILGILSALIMVLMCLCDVFVFKITSIFGYTLALSGIIFPFISLLIICINEVYGHRQAIFSLFSLVCAQVFFLIGLILLPHLPSPIDFSPKIQNAYNLIFSQEWRVIFSSPIGISVSLYLSSVINSKLKTYFWGKLFLFRAFITTVITTAVMVSIIYPINFIGILNIKQIISIVIDTYIYKIVMSVFILFISKPVVSFLRKTEKKYIFDLSTEYSPFEIFSAKNIGVNLYEKFYK